MITTLVRIEVGDHCEDAVMIIRGTGSVVKMFQVVEV